MNVRHILLTTDLSKDALRPFAPVLELARELGSRVSVLHVVENRPFAPGGLSAPDPKRDEAAREALTRQAAGLGKGVELRLEVLEHPDPAAGIVAWAVENDVDLIALSTHGRTGVRHLTLGSVAEKVLRQSPIPVLSFHRPGA